MAGAPEYEIESITPIYPTTGTTGQISGVLITLTIKQ